MQTVAGQVVDLAAGQIVPARVEVADGRIARIVPDPAAPDRFLIPGFIDAHVHVESSMLAPYEFARAASLHGTVATVSDPHEIANVLGVPGVEFMLTDAAGAAVKMFFGAPSCVPATVFESAGATLDATAVDALLARPEILYLSEVMNFPGVLAGDPDLLAKIAAARRRGKAVDGHAPGLRGARAAAYAAAGITTDHECTGLDEARDKITAGMKILLREGSAARNYAAIEPLLFSDPGSCMFCTDDLHPDALAEGHINRLVRRAVTAGLPALDALRIACVHPVQHYHLPVGLLRPGDPADFLMVDDLVDFRVRQTWVDGRLVAEEGASLLPARPPQPVNAFAAEPVSPAALRIPCPVATADVPVIVVEDGQLVTGREIRRLTPTAGELRAEPARDLLKLAVVNRYTPGLPPALAFITHFGLRRGAIASSVAHDSHNLIAVGADDESLARALNLLVTHRGGVCAVDSDREVVLPLPIAGLMSDRDAATVAHDYAAVEDLARGLGSPLRAPLMTLSFMALLVIPSLKLSDRGLFDGDAFAFVPLVPPAGKIDTTGPHR
jgi:adenine deaminase